MWTYIYILPEQMDCTYKSRPKGSSLHLESKNTVVIVLMGGEGTKGRTLILLSIFLGHSILNLRISIYKRHGRMHRNSSFRTFKYAYTFDDTLQITIRRNVKNIILYLTINVHRRWLGAIIVDVMTDVYGTKIRVPNPLACKICTYISKTLYIIRMHCCTN